MYSILNLEQCFNNAIMSDAELIGVAVKMPNIKRPEIIINYKENFKSKLNYYKMAYTDDLKLKNCKDIQIVGFTYGADMQEIERDLRMIYNQFLKEIEMDI